MATGGLGPSKERSNVSAKGAELSDEQMNSIYEAFAVFDVEKNGIIATQNLKVKISWTFILTDLYNAVG